VIVMNLIEMSVMAVALIIVIIIIRSLFLNHLPKITFPILWAVVLMRLMLPFTFQTEISLNAFSRPFFTNVFSSDESMPNYRAENIAVGNQSVVEQGESPTITPSYNFSNLLSSETANDLTVASDADQINWIVVVWIAGIVLSGTYFIIGHRKAHRLLSAAVKVETEFLNNWKKEQNLRRTLAILTSDQVRTPLTLGIFKPKIIIPAAMEIQNDTNFHYVLAHEFYHIKRVDALWKLLAVTVVCVHWFNPFVWVAFVLANRDLEISCDAWVMKKFEENTKKSYASALISMAEYQNDFIPLYNYFARNTIEERVETIMKTKKITVVGSVAAVAIVGLLGFNAFAASINEDDESQDSSYVNPDSSHTTDTQGISTDFQHLLPPSELEQPYTTDTFTVDGFTVIEIIPIGFSRVNGDVPSDDALATDEIALIGADYIWGMLGESVDGMYMELTYLFGYSNIGRESVWLGNVFDKEAGEVRGPEVRQFSFYVDSMTGEVLSFFDHSVYVERDSGLESSSNLSRFAIEGTDIKEADIEEADIKEADIEEADIEEADIEEAEEIAKFYAQRHFSSSSVISAKACWSHYHSNGVDWSFVVEDETGRVILVLLQRDTNRFRSLMEFGTPIEVGDCFWR